MVNILFSMRQEMPCCEASVWLDVVFAVQQQGSGSM